MYNLMDDHLQALRHNLCYVQRTQIYSLHLYISFTTLLISYTNYDWGGCSDTRRSTSVYYVFLGDNLLSCSSKRKPVLYRSSVEAEYHGVANVVSESCQLHNLLLVLHCPIHKAIMVYCDNISAIYLSGNPIQHLRMKYIKMDIHFVREKVARSHVRVLHIPLRFQMQDIFTKGAPFILFRRHSQRMSTSCFNCVDILKYVYIHYKYHIHQALVILY